MERITAGVADRLERAGGYLERANGEEMLRDAERFVRTRPWVVAGAAAAAGLVASRIFKASSERRYDQSSNTSKPAGAPVTRSRLAELRGSLGRRAAGRDAWASVLRGVAMSTHQANDLHDRPIGEVAAALTRDLSLLVRQELDLAKAEMREKGKVALPGLGMMGAAGAVALLAGGALTAFLVLVLSLFLDDWLAALITGLGLAGLAAALALAGKERVEEMGTPLPEQTIETIKEDAAWMKEQAKSARE